jgi:serine phosphatase RsbU (regulator of sigma subunit)
MRYWLAILCFFYVQYGSSQDIIANKKFYLVDSLYLNQISETDKQLIDSCLTIFHQSKIDTIRASALNFIIESSWDEKVWPKYNFWISDWLKSKLKTNNLDAKTQKKLKTLFAGSLINTGYYYRLIGDIQKALEYYNLSFIEYEKLNEKQGLAYCLNNMGVIYDSYGDLPRALDAYQKSLTFQDEINDLEGIANSLNNIGAIYKILDETEKAFEYYYKSLSIQQKINNKRGEAMISLKIGDLHRINNNLDTAEFYYIRSLNISNEIGNKSVKASTLREIGNLYLTKNDIQKALKHYTEAIELYESINDVEEIVKSYNNIAMLYFKTNKYENTKYYAQKALNLSKKLGYVEGISATAKLLSNIYEIENNTNKAYEMYKLHITMRDSIKNTKNEKLAIKSQLQYEYEQKQKLLKIEKEKEILIAKEEKKRHQAINIAFSLGITLFLIFLIILYNRLKVTNRQKKIISITNQELNISNEELAKQRDEIEKQKDKIIIQKKILENKNQEITDSITYAKRIQESILPSNELIKELLPHSFVLYKPKDIVAGDFYWVEKINDLVLFSVADCTGHGVPGAMVSVICHTALNRVVREYHYYNPAEILNKTREIIAERFQNNSNDVQDGMDISICTWDKKTNTIQFAGANTSIYIIRKDSKTIEIIKGDKQPVGYFQNFSPFKQVEIKISDGDTVYLFSDGYADQFGGDFNKKIGYQLFRETLTSISHLPLNLQKNELDKLFEKWKANSEQIDDICILGVKV